MPGIHREDRRAQHTVATQARHGRISSDSVLRNEPNCLIVEGRGSVLVWQWDTMDVAGSAFGFVFEGAGRPHEAPTPWSPPRRGARCRYGGNRAGCPTNLMASGALALQNLHGGALLDPIGAFVVACAANQS